MFQNRIKDYIYWMISNPFLLTAKGKNNLQKEITHDWSERFQGESKTVTPRKRLGFLYEDLVSHLITQHHSYEIVDRNIQIIENGKTHGEIDFVVLNKTTDQLIQLESAVKFYLFHPQSGMWIGPNANDKLHLKYNKLIEKQLNLYRDFEELIPYNISESQLWTNGMLFVPQGSDYQLPEYVNKNVEIENWFFKSDEEKPKGVPLNKNEWIIPTDKIHSQLAMKRKSTLEKSSMLLNTASNNKFFLVHENWPNS
ncbi:DUF1853 family protein [Salibacter sp.]|uniref:DUF1853 family protein n=1 Tax=Salibacter sp. TaxID=2010995 RepID=UPI0028707C1A|nr:DUF1853 family protein [Salibacter sp.]MDR9399539.1 DUF1853 family protein [Salibacter sp.]MDR9488447.1 DUF1853 family protein [Salibacter sp.]